MKKIILIIICLFIVTACGSNVAKEYKDTYKTINMKETKKLYKEGNTKVVDVRSEKEYDKKHYKGAINIPYKYIDNIVNIVSKDEIVIIYAGDEKVSKKACEKVIDKGYSLVYDLGKYE